MRPAAAQFNLEKVHIEYGSRVPGHPAEEREAVIRDLLQPLPTVNSKYFYDDRGSRLFEEITALPEYYQTRTEEALLENTAAEIASLTRARNLVELGSGAGRKIRLLLDAIQKAGRLDGCVLLDINQTFLLLSTRRLAEEYPGIDIVGWVGDFVHDLGEFGRSSHRLFVFLAGTIGNLHPAERTTFLRALRSVLGPGESFLVGLDLIKDIDRLEAAYNDAAGVTAEFNRNILRVLNRNFGTDFNPDAFEHVAFYEPRNEWIEMRLRALQSMSVDLGRGRRLRLEAGDEIRTEISCKFTRPSFQRSLIDTGLRVSRWFTDPADLFALALVRPESDHG